MSRLIGCLSVLLFSLSLAGHETLAQMEASPQTIKGDLLSIKGDVYVIKDISGRLTYLHIDKKRSVNGSWFPAKKSKRM